MCQTLFWASGTCKTQETEILVLMDWRQGKFPSATGKQIQLSERAQECKVGL